MKRPMITTGYIPGRFGVWGERWGYVPTELREYGDGLSVVTLVSQRTLGDRAVMLAWDRTKGTGGMRPSGLPMRGAMAYVITGTPQELSHFVRKARRQMPTWAA